MKKRDNKFLVQAWLNEEDFLKISEIADKFETSRGSVIKIIIKNLDNIKLNFENKKE